MKSSIIIAETLKFKKQLARKNKKTEFEEWNKQKLAEIAYLFKNPEYQHMQETRLIIRRIGFKKKINRQRNPPGVYIESLSILLLLKKIILEPKMEQDEEWVAFFHYQLVKKNIQDREISIS